MIKLIYTLFLGLLLALFVGMGIRAFYAPPKPPDYSVAPYSTPIKEPLIPDVETPAQKQTREQAKKVQDNYQAASKLYARNVSLISLAFAIVLLVVSLMSATKIDIISDGILLGGVFILLYSIGVGFASDDTKYQFMVVTAGLIIAFVLGYMKFIAPQEKKA